MVHHCCKALPEREQSQHIPVVGDNPEGPIQNSSQPSNTPWMQSGHFQWNSQRTKSYEDPTQSLQQWRGERTSAVEVEGKYDGNNPLKSPSPQDTYRISGVSQALLLKFGEGGPRHSDLLLLLCWHSWFITEPS